MGALPLKGLMNQNIQECDHIPNVMKSTSWEWQRLIGPQDMLRLVEYVTARIPECFVTRTWHIN